MYVACLELAGSVFLNVASYLLYRSVVGAPPSVWWPVFLLGLMLGAGNAALFARSITSVPLSVAYPVFSGASIMFIAIAVALQFHERLLPFQVLGMAFVVLGIILIAK